MEKVRDLSEVIKLACGRAVIPPGSKGWAFIIFPTSTESLLHIPDPFLDMNMFSITLTMSKISFT